MAANLRGLGRAYQDRWRKDEVIETGATGDGPTGWLPRAVPASRFIRHIAALKSHHDDVRSFRTAVFGEAEGTEEFDVIGFRQSGDGVEFIAHRHWPPFVGFAIAVAPNI